MPTLVRVLLAFGSALLSALLVGGPFLTALRRLRLGQHIRAEGPQSHQQKAGTPTMGGIIIITAVAVALLALRAVRGPVAGAFLAMLGFGFLGFLDDLLSVTRGRNMGLKARQKLLGQALLAVLLGLYAAREGLGNGILLPFTALRVDLGTVFLAVLSTLVLVSASNGVNLADGLDGLAAGTVAIAAAAQGALALFFGRPEIALFAAAVAGAALGFLWFNAHPAAVFMGDTGSLALGGALGAMAVLTRTMFYLPLTGGIFVLETLAVIIQVVSFQTTRRRVFRMAPLHHHFELGGWGEVKTVVRFWLISSICGLIGVLAAWPAIVG